MKQHEYELNISRKYLEETKAALDAYRTCEEILLKLSHFEPLARSRIELGYHIIAHDYFLNVDLKIDYYSELAFLAMQFASLTNKSIDWRVAGTNFILAMQFFSAINCFNEIPEFFVNFEEWEELLDNFAKKNKGKEISLFFHDYANYTLDNPDKQDVEQIAKNFALAKMHKEAATLFSAATEKVSGADAVRLYIEAAKYFEMEKMFKEAGFCFCEAGNTPGSDASRLFTRGAESFVLAKMPREAAFSFSQAAGKRTGADVIGLYEKAAEYYALAKMPKEAAFCFSEAAKIPGSHAFQLQIKSAQYFVQARMPGEAAFGFTAAAKNAPDANSAPLYIKAAGLYALAKMPKESAFCFSKAANLPGANAPLLFGKAAECFTQAEMPKESAFCFSKAANLPGANAPLLLGKAAECFIQAEMPKEAGFCFLKVAKKMLGVDAIPYYKKAAEQYDLAGISPKKTECLHAVKKIQSGNFSENNSKTNNKNSDQFFEKAKRPAIKSEQADSILITDHSHLLSTKNPYKRKFFDSPQDVPNKKRRLNTSKDVASLIVSRGVN